MRKSVPKKKRCVGTIVAALLLSGVVFLQSCEKDELTGQPSWLGNSIYERLQDDGNYSYTLRLIDDLEQTSVSSSLRVMYGESSGMKISRLPRKSYCLMQR